MLQAGGLTWRDLAYESPAGLCSAICVDVHTPVCAFVSNVAVNFSEVEDIAGYRTVSVLASTGG